MLYALLCFNSEAAVTSWTAEEDAAVMARLDVVHARLAAEGKLGPAARLAPTARAKVMHKGTNGALVTDGPYAETKEQMLGFYLVDVADEGEALAVARDLEAANPGVGGYELRPITLFEPGAGAWARRSEPA